MPTPEQLARLGALDTEIQTHIRALMERCREISGIVNGHVNDPKEQDMASCSAALQATLQALEFLVNEASPEPSGRGGYATVTYAMAQAMGAYLTMRGGDICEFYDDLAHPMAHRMEMELSSGAVRTVAAVVEDGPANDDLASTPPRGGC